MKQTNAVKDLVFTVAEHLNVQEQTERRAYELWRARCRQRGTALDDWVRAEREVLQDFIARRQHSL